MSVEFQDYYATLGVAKDASQEEIRKSYRALARKFHPDVNKDPDSGERFKKITEANEVLSDPEKRKRYDELGANWQQGEQFRPPPDWEQRGFNFGSGGSFASGGQADFSDFFSAFFGGFGGEDTASRFRNRPRAGSSIEANITLSLEELYSGGTREISLQNTAAGGEIFTYQVKIPPGIKEGSVIRLSGKGEAGHQGGKAGDLFLNVHVAPHPRFTVKGFNLHSRLPIAPWEAVLGTTIDYLLLDGSKVKLKIAPGSQNNQKLKLKNKGLKKTATQNGDLFVELQIAVPRQTDEKARKLWEELQGISSFNPRG